MTALTLPWFHTDALQQRFNQQLLAAHLTDQDRLWLEQVHNPARDHQPGADDEMRVDWVSAVTDAGQAIDLPITVMISRSSASWGLFYNPLSGLHAFADRAEAKAYLLANIQQGETGLALRFLSPCGEQRQLQAGVVEDFQLTLLEGSVFDALMLRINDRLGDDLRALRQCLRDQPTPGQLLDPQLTGPALGLHAAAQLQRYWNTATVDTAAPSDSLTHVLRTRLITSLAQQQWQGTLDAPAQRQLVAWLADAYPMLHSFTLAVVAADGTPWPLDDLLVLGGATLDAPCYTYSAAWGITAYANRTALLAQLADAAQRQTWLACVAPSRQAELQALPISGMHLEPLAGPALDAYCQRLLKLQQDTLHQSLVQLGAPDPDTICQRALRLEARLDPRLQRLASPFPADIRDSPASLAYLSRLALRDAREPDRLIIHLNDLLLQYTSYRQRGPSLLSVTLQELALETASLMEAGPAMAAVQLLDVTRASTLPPAEAVWRALAPLPEAAAPQWQAAIPVAEGASAPLVQLHPTLVGHALARCGRHLRQALQGALAHRERLGQGYHLKLDTLLATLEGRLLEQHGADPTTQRSPREAQPVPTHLPGEQRQAAVLHAYDRLIGHGLPSACLPDLLRAATESDSTEAHILRLQDTARRLAVQRVIPAWLRDATAEQQHHYVQALAFNVLASPGEEDYLFGIPDIHAYAEAALQARLDQDFAPGRFRPGAVFITTERYITPLPAPGDIPSGTAAATEHHRQSLIEYALNHYRDWDHSLIAVELGAGHPAPAELDAQYLRALVKGLDVGGHYQGLLRTAFDASNPQYPRRLSLFCQQLPGQLLERAWRAHLQGALPQAAVELITRVITQPDAELRQPLDGKIVDLMPLQLIPSPGEPAATVPECYLFSTRGDGLRVLYMPYESAATFQTFAHGAALLSALASDVPLQQRLLARMPDDLRTVYDHGGFAEPHLGFSVESDFDFVPARPGPVSLGNQPVEGSALRYLFEENAKALQNQAKAQLITRDEARWTTLVNVLSLVWEQLTLFLPGKVGLVVAAWQVELATLNIARTLQHRDWGQTLAELTCALVQGLLIGNAALQPSHRPTSREAFWRTLREDPHYGLALASYEAPSQSLGELQFEADTHTYRRSSGTERFITLGSKLYQCMTDQGHWYLAGQRGEEPGPLLTLNERGHWAIDPDQIRHLNEGGVASRVGSGLVRWALTHDDVVIQAVGARQIRRLMPYRARMLVNAHRDALVYLALSLENLRRATPVSRGAAHTLQILKDFFGVARVSNDLIERIREPLENMLTVMASRAYSPRTSRRYVMGSRSDNALGIAFTSPHDPSRQIFLLEGFFEFDGARHFALEPQFSAEQANALSQTMVLLHEFTHVACNTRDIRYIEAASPYADRLLAGRRRAWLNRHHDELFSHRTPAAQLFKIIDAGTGQSRDLRDSDRKGYGLVMRLSGATTLDDARHRFLDNDDVRANILLMNADSLTLLIYRLGQQVY